MAKHFHGGRAGGRRRQQPPQEHHRFAPSAMLPPPVKHLRVMEREVEGGRRDGLPDAVTLSESISGKSSDGSLLQARRGNSRCDPPALFSWPEPQVASVAVTLSESNSGELRPGLGSSDATVSFLPRCPSVSAVSTDPLDWCDAPSAVQLRLVQLGIRTSLDLAGFFDSVADARESLRTTLSGVDLDAAVAAWEEATAVSRLHVRRIAGSLHQGSRGHAPTTSSRSSATPAVASTPQEPAPPPPLHTTHMPTL